jgi:hypothetical protein
MNYRNIALFGGGMLVMGSLAMAASNVTWNQTMTNQGVKRPGVIQPRPKAPSVVAPMAQIDGATRLELVSPPAEMAIPSVASPMTTPTGADAIAMKAPLPTLEGEIGKYRTPAVAARPGKPKPQAAMAAAQKPGKLFSYVRLLNFSPHPQEEEFLRDKPLALNGRNYHISVTYREDWKVVSDDEGYLKKIGFDIKLYENEKLVRTLKIPAVALDPKAIKKGLVLGLAEVAPYSFKIAVDSWTISKKGISELVFKFDMNG